MEVPQIYTAQARADYRHATWHGVSNNHTNRNQGAKRIDMIIHIAQGSCSRTMSLFNKAYSDVSAHYVVAKDGRVAQCVRNEDIAWHAGYWRYNKMSIGIEQTGYASKPRTARQYRSSARLSAYLVRRFNIPIGRNHIIGHNQVSGRPGAGGGNSCHTDPGRYWNWERYMRLIRRYR